MIEVLVVDDDTRVARVNAAYVEKVPGFHVAGQAHSALEALRSVETLPRLDLILLDHYLPTAPAWRWSGRCGAGATRPTSSW